MNLDDLNEENLKEIKSLPKWKTRTVYFFVAGIVFAGLFQVGQDTTDLVKLLIKLLSE